MREVEVQGWSPISTPSLKRVTRSTAHPKMRCWGGANHVPCISGVQKFVPRIVSNATCDLSPRPKSPKKLAFAALFAVVYLDHLLQALLNLEKGIIGAEWTLGNIAIAQDGVRALDLEAYIRLAEGRWPEGSSKTRKSNFFAAEVAAELRAIEHRREQVRYDTACGMSPQEKTPTHASGAIP